MIRLTLIYIALVFLGSCKDSEEATVVYGSINYPQFTFSINGGDSYTSSSTVQVTLTGQTEDIESYRFFRSATCLNTSWLPYQENFQVGLDSAEGSKFISMQVKSKLGFESPCITQSIYLDKSAPVFLALPLTVSSQFSNFMDRSPRLTWGSAVDSGSGLARYKIALGSSAGATDIVDWQDIGVTQEYQFLNLNVVHGAVYYVSLIAIDQSNFESSVQQVQWLVDNVAPLAVNKLVHYQSTNLSVVPLISWEAVTDSQAGVSHYEIALGDAPGATNIKDWQNIGEITEYTFNNLTMVHGSQYFPSLRVVDKAGNISSVTSSVGWRAVNKWRLGTRSTVLAGFYQMSMTLSDSSRITVGNPWSGLILKQSSNGDVDSQFQANIGSGFNGSYTLTVFEQPNGKLLVGGLFDQFNGQSRNNLLRLNADGTLDESFVVGSGFNGQVNQVMGLSNSKILVGGFFTTYQGISTPGLVRLNEDGSRDASFQSLAAGDVRSFAISTQDNKIYVGGGGFFALDGIVANYVSRRLENGSHDMTFSVVGSFMGTLVGNDVVSIIQAQRWSADGKIYIGGGFNHNGIANNKLIKVNPDGTTDNSFQTLSIVGGRVRVVKDLPDGRILVGGHFTSVNGLNYSKLVRINPNGTVDETFNIGSGFHSGDAIYAIEDLPDGRFFIDGYLTQFDGQPVSRGVLLEW